MTKILMVCTANICRSPMARDVAQHMAREMAGVAHFKFDSAGTRALPGGERVDPRARSVLTRRGYKPGNKRSRPVNEQDFGRFDLIVAMDRANLALLQGLCPAQHQHKLHLLLEFAPTLGISEVPDPYHGNLEGFERVLGLCEEGVRGLLVAMRQRLGAGDV